MTFKQNRPNPLCEFVGRKRDNNGWQKRKKTNSSPGSFAMDIKSIYSRVIDKALVVLTIFLVMTDIAFGPRAGFIVCVINLNLVIMVEFAVNMWFNYFNRFFWQQSTNILI
ncbi:MAG: hypothetical protein K8S13_01395 [Desulfobacula sp.]|uniref:hypothetical protein n=1 Tax=Desulfobacula sp. TaxID=2593537 RepID=UPI0025C56ED7|nr:hypothetical protein [Desulfobacula sp.]MCD4718502.1 hypothetical protein [Desulfobacula sp.]